MYQQIGELFFDAQIDPDSIKHLYALPKLKKLLVLDSSHCQDYHFSVEGFQHLTKLRIDAMFNAIPEGVGSLQTLEILELEMKNVTTINFSLEKLKQLQTLSLCLTSCNTLPKGIFELPNLKELRLHTGAYIPNDITKLTNLNQLVLTISNEQGTPHFYEKLPIYEHVGLLGISGEGLEPFPAWIANKNVSWLSYEGMCLGAIPEYLLDFDRLYSLALQNCGISEIPTWITKLTEVHSIYLDRNEITHVPDEILSMNLVHLSLSGNPISEQERKRVQDVMGQTVLFE